MLLHYQLRKIYHDNNQLRTVLVYKDGKKHSVKNNYSSTGKKLPKGDLIKGTGQVYYYNDSVIDYVSFLENGEWIRDSVVFEE